jgi:hypothetical protein
MALTRLHIGSLVLGVSAAIVLAAPVQRAPAQAAPAVSVTGAQILWYGIYTADSQKRVDDAATGSGTRMISENAKPPKVNSDRIALAEGIRFGIGYRLTGEPKGAVVKIKQVHKYPAPGMFNKVKGQRVPSGEIVRDREIGGDDQYTGHVVGNPANYPVGKWTIELWYGDRKLAEKSLEVYRP